MLLQKGIDAIAKGGWCYLKRRLMLLQKGGGATGTAFGFICFYLKNKYEHRRSFMTCCSKAQ